MTGQRKEAIMTLRWDQVDFKSNLIDFNDRTAPLYHRMKGRGVVPMSSALRGYLKGLVRDSDWVISKAGKQVLTIDTSWRKVMKATRFKITPHVLRHTVATTLAMKSVPMTQIARILGHSNTQITERVYAKFSLFKHAKSKRQRTLGRQLGRRDGVRASLRQAATADHEPS
jgi:integrase